MIQSAPNIFGLKVRLVVVVERKRKVLTIAERETRKEKYEYMLACAAKKRQTWQRIHNGWRQKAHNVLESDFPDRQRGKKLYIIFNHGGIVKESTKAYCFEMWSLYDLTCDQWIPKACVNNVDKDTVTVAAKFFNRSMPLVSPLGAEYIWIVS